MAAKWPEAGPVDHTLLKESEYLTHVSHEFRVRINKMMDMRGKVSAALHILYSPISLHCRLHNYLFLNFFSLFFQKSSPSEGFASPEYGVIYVAQEYPRWQHVTLTILSGLYNEVRGRREVRT